MELKNPCCVRGPSAGSHLFVEEPQHEDERRFSQEQKQEDHEKLGRERKNREPYEHLMIAVMSSVYGRASHRHQQTPLLLQSPQTAQEPRHHGNAPCDQQQVGHGERREGQREVRDLSLTKGKPHPYTKQATPTQLFTRQAQVIIYSFPKQKVKSLP